MTGKFTLPTAAAPPPGMLIMRRVLVALLASLLALGALPTHIAAQEMEVPIAVQVPLFLKVLTFDRRFAERNRDEIVIAVVFQNGFRASQVVSDEVVRALAGTSTIEGRRVRTVTIDLDRESLAAALQRHRTTVLYVAPVRGVDIGGIANMSRSYGITSFTGVARYVSQGVSVGVRLQGDRPRLLINVEASRLEGADFKSELLRLAQVTS